MYPELPLYQAWMDAELRAKQARAELRFYAGGTLSASETHEAASIANTLSHEANALFEAAMEEIKVASTALHHQRMAS